MSSAKGRHVGASNGLARREFLNLGASAALAATVSQGVRPKHVAGGTDVSAEKKGPPADDRMHIDYAGDRYQAVVPDTLDLAERAALALNGLGGTSDPAMGGLHYFNQLGVTGAPLCGDVAWGLVL